MADHESRVILSLIDKNFASGLKSAIGKAKEFGASVKEHLNNAGTAISAAGGAITAFGMTSLKSFGDTQTQLNKAAITAGGTSKNIGELAAVANKMGKDLPLSAEDASRAMVGMAQNGANLKQLKDQFPAIAKASTAAGADLGATADAVQQAYNIWGGSAKQNAAILVQTANASNASIETMKDAYANVGTNAKALGIDLGTTSEAIGLLTNKGMTSARASMDLNHALTQMVKPSKAAQGTMDELGISYTDAHGKMKPFKEILQELNTALANYTPTQKQAALATMYGTAGEQAMLPLLEAVNDKTGNVSTSWDAYEKNMQKAAGTAKTAGKTLDSQASEMQKNVGSALEQVGGSWDDLKNTALQSQDTLLRKTLNNISNIITHIQQGKDVFSKVVKGAIGLAPVLGPALLAVGGFAKAISQIGQLMNPWVLFAAVVAGLSAKFVEVYNSSKPLRDAIKSIGDAFKSVFGDQIKNLLNGIKDFFDSIDGKSKGSKKQLSSIGSSLAQGIRSIDWKGIFNGFKEAIDDVSAFLKKIDWKDIFNDIKSIIGQVFTFVKDEWNILKASGMGDAIATLATAIVNLVKGALDTLVGVLPSITADIESATAVIGPIISVIAQVIGVLGNVIGKILQANGAMIKAHPVIGQIEVALLGLGIRFGSLYSTFRKVFGLRAGKALKGALSFDANNILAGARKLKDGFLGIFGKEGSIVKGFKSFTGFFKKGGGLSSAFAKLKGAFGKSKESGLLSKLGKQLTSFKGKIKSFGSSIASFAKKVGSNLGKALKNVGSFSKRVAIGLKNGFVKGIKAVGSTLKKFGGTLKTAFSKGLSLTKKLGKGVVDVAKKFGTNALKLAKKAGNGLVKVAQIMANGFKSAMSAIGGAFKKLITLISANPYAAAIAAVVAVVGVLVWFFTKTKTGRRMWSNFLKWFRNAWQNLSKWLSNLWNGMKKAAENIWNAIKNVIKWYVNTYKMIITKVWGATIGWVIKSWSNMFKSVKDIFSHGQYYMTHPIKAAQKLIGTYIDQIKNLFKSLGLINLWNAGKKVIDGFLNGIKSGYEKVKDGLHNITKDMPLHKGPESVDRVLLEPAGRLIMQGLNKGIVDKYADVRNTLHNITNDIADSAYSLPSAFNRQLDDLSVRSKLSLQTDLQNQQIQVDRRPANINFSLGGHEYHTFVNDITNEQDRQYDLQRRR